MTKSAADRAEVRFKQLCCLGLGGEEIVPALLSELQMIVPSLGSTFFFLDAKSELSNVYDENPAAPAVALLYLEQFYKRPDREMGAGFPDAFKGQSGVQGIDEILNVDRETFYRSDLYNLVYRPLGYDGMIRVAFLGTQPSRWGADAFQVARRSTVWCRRKAPAWRLTSILCPCPVGLWPKRRADG